MSWPVTEDALQALGNEIVTSAAGAVNKTPSCTTNRLLVEPSVTQPWRSTNSPSCSPARCARARSSS